MSDPTPQISPGNAHNTLTGNPSGPTVQAGTVYGGVGNTTVVRQGPAAPKALDAVPGPPDGFTGRAQDLDQITVRLDPAASQGPGAPVVSALSGMGGVGKTALALKAAQVAWESQWFCAHLFVDLHGYTPHAPPVTAPAALDALLRQAGVDPDDIPAKVGERAGFYRAALQALTRADERGRPVLVVADNAHHLDQVEPLLPGPGGHRLLVTSRARLAVGGHQPLSLDTLPAEEAVELITARLGPDDPRSGDTEGLADLAHRCGHLPLALKIAAALLASKEHLSPGRLAQRLAQTARFTDGRDDLTAVFTASLDHLPPKRVRVFALLGSHPGPDISTAAAAALTDLQPEQVEEVLEELAAAHLLTAHPGDRWSMHDLLADHARHHHLPAKDTEQTGQEESRQRAVVRLLDFYTTTADAANDHLRALNGDTPPAVFTGRAQALAWLEAEHDNLIAAVRTAHRIGHAHTATRLPSCLAEYLLLRRQSDDAIAVHTLARDTAHHHDDAHGEASAWNNLGNALQQVRRFEEAIDAHTRARDLSQHVGDAHREASAWNNLGNALRRVRRFEEAIDAHTRAQEAFQRVGDARSEASAWNNLGLALRRVRRFEEAIDAHTRAQEAFQRVGDAHREAMAWNNLGNALQQVRRFGETIDAHTRARDLHQQMGDAHGEAMAWNNLGNALRQVWREQEAREAFELAAQGFRALGDEHSLAVAQGNLTQLRQWPRRWWRFWGR
ncbi:hypothetical protein CQJ94_15375 [Glycomyces fuscus]|nr:hypothetical protein CQJ94_15375 [Glycomyces fuscus]